MLQEKVALITGARGIGGATAQLLAARGASVIVTYKQNAQAAAQLISSIVQAGGHAEAIQSDVLEREQTDHLVKTIHDKYGRLDIVVSNAAVGWLEKPFAELVWNEFSQVVEHELKAAFDLTQAALPIMVQQKSGRLIYMASNLATHTLPNTIASSVSKAALLAFMRNIAAEYGPLGITANAIAPAMVSTETNQYIPHAALDAIKAYTPLRRIASPEDVAATVAFLAGKDSAFITGTCLVIDGGKTLAA